MLVSSATMKTASMSEMVRSANLMPVGYPDSGFPAVLDPSSIASLPPAFSCEASANSVAVSSVSMSVFSGSFVSIESVAIWTSSSVVEARLSLISSGVILSDAIVSFQNQSTI